MTIVSKNEEAFLFTNVIHNLAWYKVYCDGSGFQGAAGATAILYKGERIIKSLQLHVGPTKHMVYETKLIGLVALHLLSMLNFQQW